MNLVKIIYKDLAKIILRDLAKKILKDLINRDLAIIKIINMGLNNNNLPKVIILKNLDKYKKKSNIVNLNFQL